VIWVVANGSAVAAWNNVFQVCCHNCRSSNYVAAPAPVVASYGNGCGCQQCTTRYVQRCYYQPVTTYQQSCYMEPVTTYRTSYYYEPCTSYRYSCYYDPCTCSYQQVAQPVTTYRLRSQCCPVTSYLQRCCLKPVTTYQQMTYYEPQTTCCTTTIGAPVAAPPAAASVVPSAPQAAVQGTPMVPAPGVSGAPAGGAPGVTGQPYMPPAGVSGEPQPPAQGAGSSYRQPRLQAPVPAQPVSPTPRPRVRLDRVTTMPRYNTEGQVVRADRVPQAGMKVIFVCADSQGGRQSLTTNGLGRFQTTLAAGNWLIYTQDAAGRLVYQQKVLVAADAPTAAPITLVSR
jgi:hypothetical protein